MAWVTLGGGIEREGPPDSDAQGRVASHLGLPGKWRLGSRAAGGMSPWLLQPTQGDLRKGRTLYDHTPSIIYTLETEMATRAWERERWQGDSDPRPPKTWDQGKRRMRGHNWMPIFLLLQKTRETWPFQTTNDQIGCIWSYLSPLPATSCYRASAHAIPSDLSSLPFPPPPILPIRASPSPSHLLYAQADPCSSVAETCSH